MTEPFTEMEVHDDYIPERLFTDFISRMPQVCVELIVDTDRGILLAKRNQHPEVWFWPGGRVYKGETLVNAAYRVAETELGISIVIQDQYGPYEHFWEHSGIEESPSRHTVNSVFHVTPQNESYEITLDDQHADYRFITEITPDLHDYVQLYLRDNNLLEHSSNHS